MGKIKDLTGQRFGRLVAIECVGRDKFGNAIWLCQCDCGNQKIVRQQYLCEGRIVSCGCYNKEKAKFNNQGYKHGGKYTRLYRIWRGIKDRCINHNSQHWDDYGGRGIKMCDEWVSDFVVFRDWALSNGYSPELSIDRIDNNGNYTPDNCRWVNIFVQANNRRDNKRYEYNGISKTISQWSKETGIQESTLNLRLKRWPIERALTEPVHNTGGRKRH